MSSSQTQICNMALSKFGARSIGNINDDSLEARKCKVLWNSVLETLLYSYGWNFALTRVSLGSPLSTTPEFGYDYAYSLPGDCLRVWELYNSTSNWAVEGKKFLCSDDEPQIRYIKRVTDTGLFSPAFVICLATALAVELSTQLADDAKYRQLLQSELNQQIASAEKVHAHEGNEPRSKDEEASDAGNFSWQMEGR